LQHCQPIFERHCTRCHAGAEPAGGVDLTAALVKKDARGYARRHPVSYDNLIRGGFVHYTNARNSADNQLLPPKSFGSLQSPLVRLLEPSHYEVQLGVAERKRLLLWIDLNCPLWGDYDSTVKPVPNTRTVSSAK
jgi:hypothetical protein